MKTSLDSNIQAFLELLRAGLWEKEARLLHFMDLNYSSIMRLAEEQCVLGLITAGLEHVSDIKVPKEEVLQFIGQALQLEQRNRAMNKYVAWLIEKLRDRDIYTLLVKGQGVAQCYERPLWRNSGDVDLLLSEINYDKAKLALVPLASEVGKEYKTFKHIALTMPDGYVVELHGTLHSRLSKRVDKVIDEAQRDVFYGGNVRSWNNGGTTVFLPSPVNDVIFIFTHILHHFFIDGIGLRQICDWCRLLWTYKDSLDHELLEQRIRKAGLMSEWKAFAALAVDYLGMPADAMPFYSPDNKWRRNEERILAFIIETGNLGHNRLIKWSSSRFVRKIQSGWRKLSDLCRISRVFPIDSFRFFCHFLGQGIKNTIKGE